MITSISMHFPMFEFSVDIFFIVILFFILQKQILFYYFLEECDSNDKFLEHKFNDEGKKMPEAYVNMYTYFWETAKNLEKFKFPQTLPVTLFTSTGLIKYIDKEIEEKILKTRVEDYLNSMITNNNIQKIHVLEGTHYLHDSQYKNMSEIIKQNLFLWNKK